MNQGNVKIGAGRVVAAVVLGALLALISPLLLLVELFMPVAVVLLPSVALVALYRWAGRGPALATAVMMVASAALLTGNTFMLIALAMMVLPPLLVLRMQDRPFFEQLRFSIAAFGVGMLVAAAALFFRFGGNMIERVFGQFPEMVRALPEEYIVPMLESMSSLLGRTVTVDGFYEIYDSMIKELIPVYQMLLPQRLFSGVLISALLCAWLSNRMRARRGEAAPGSYAPLREWALPASTTGGLLLLLVASWVLDLIGVTGAETAYYAAYGIASVAFGVQALGSAARRLRMTSMRPGGQHAALIAIAVVGTLLLPDALMVYGGASAILGSRGALRQRAENRNDDGRFGGGE